MFLIGQVHEPATKQTSPTCISTELSAASDTGPLCSGLTDRQSVSDLVVRPRFGLVRFLCLAVVEAFELTQTGYDRSWP